MYVVVSSVHLSMIKTTDCFLVFFHYMFEHFLTVCIIDCCENWYLLHGQCYLPLRQCYYKNSDLQAVQIDMFVLLIFLQRK